MKAYARLLPARMPRTLSASTLVVFCSFALPSLASEAWQAIEPGIWRSGQMPYTYAIQERDTCLLIGAASFTGPEAAKLPPGNANCHLVLLTHHHRDSCAAVASFVAAKVKVRAPAASQAYLSVDGVKKYWDISLPQITPGTFPPLFHRFWSDWSFLVHPTGVAGIDFDLTDGDQIDWADWKLKVVSTPGHSKDHTAYVASHAKTGRVICFCGDAISAPGKIWSPYTMEWHHQQDEGLRAASASLRKLGHTKPNVLYPEHGEPIRERISEALQETSLRLDQAAQLKNFDAYTKQVIGNPSAYRLLAEEQVGTANPQGNSVTWTKLSPHLFLTGNTYALASKEGPVLLVDPYALNLVPRLKELQERYGVGPVEVALISHAHNDHYTGIFALPNRKAFEVWTLDLIADVVDHPWKYRAPYVDPRTPNVDRILTDGEVVKWREYELTIHHHPGQTKYAMGVEVTIDGKRCLFSGDNFYHVDQYTGSGGWSGRNTGLPGGYATTAKKILDMRPDWILAEHGGAFEFNAEDFQRRCDWAQKAAEIADAISPYGDHTFDWDPQRIRIEPVVCQVKAGERAELTIVGTNPRSAVQYYNLRTTGFAQYNWELAVGSGVVRETIHVQIAKDRPPGRYVVPIEIRNQAEELDTADVFVILEVISP